jgi:hypothetical protein
VFRVRQDLNFDILFRQISTFEKLKKKDKLTSSIFLLCSFSCLLQASVVELRSLSLNLESSCSLLQHNTV